MHYTPLSNVNHRQLCLKRGTFFYLQDKPLVPISVVEAHRTALDLPLGFLRKEDGSLSLMAVLSLNRDDNAQIGPKGLWMGGYMPVLVRAHPFSIVVQEDQTTIVVDADSEWLSESEGEPLFDPEGNPSKILQNLLQVLKNQAPHPNRDHPVLEAVEQSGVLVPWSDASENLFRVDPQKLAALEDQAFLELRQNKALAVLYAQLLSMPRKQRIQNLAKRKQQMIEKQSKNLDFRIFEDDDLIKYDAL